VTCFMLPLQANGLMTDDSSHINRLVRSAKWSPPDTATQAMRLQRETDFLKYVFVLLQINFIFISNFLPILCYVFN